MDPETKKSLIKIMLAMRAANGQSLPPELEAKRGKGAKKPSPTTSPSKAQSPNS